MKVFISSINSNMAAFISLRNSFGRATSAFMTSAVFLIYTSSVLSLVRERSGKFKIRKMSEKFKVRDKSGKFKVREKN